MLQIFVTHLTSKDLTEMNLTEKFYKHSAHSHLSEESHLPSEVGGSSDSTRSPAVLLPCLRIFQACSYSLALWKSKIPRPEETNI